MNLKKFTFSIVIAVSTIFSSIKVNAQSDLLGTLGEDKPKKVLVSHSWKSTRVINSHSLENVAAGVLDFRILHRFGRVNEGDYGAYGLDQASIRLGLDYGITKRLMVGIGRSSTKKEIDAFAKYRLLWQSTGPGSVPLSIDVISGVVKDGLKWTNPDRDNYYSSRFSYMFQMIIGRKFSESFTFQLSPTVIHRNLVPTKADHNDIYSLGMATRIKLSKRVAFTAEYFYTPGDQLPESITDPLSLGFDIETGGHVFQLHFTNSLGMNERALICDTNGEWGKGDIHFGFNISRVFTLSKPKTFQEKKPDQKNW
jgi:hypothetical protein